MNSKLKVLLRKVLVAVSLISGMTLTAFASSDNPLTGDNQGRLMPVVLAVLGVSLAVIIIIAVLSMKKKK